MPRRKRRVTYVYECQCVLHYGKDHFRCRSAIWRCETKNGLYSARADDSGSGSDSSSSENSSSGSSSGSKGAASPDKSSSDEGDSSSGVDEEQM